MYVELKRTLTYFHDPSLRPYQHFGFVSTFSTSLILTKFFHQQCWYGPVFLAFQGLIKMFFLFSKQNHLSYSHMKNNHDRCHTFGQYFTLILDCTHNKNSYFGDSIIWYCSLFFCWFNYMMNFKFVKNVENLPLLLNVSCDRPWEPMCQCFGT